MTSITIESLESLFLRMTVSQPMAPVELEIANRVEALGWCPLTYEAERNPETVRAHIISSVVQSSFLEALSRNRLYLAGEARMGQERVQDDELVFSADFEVLPDIDTGTFAGIYVSRPNAVITGQDVEQFTDRLKLVHKQKLPPPLGPLPEKLRAALDEASAENVEVLARQARSYMETFAAGKSSQVLRQRVLDAVVERNPFDPPSARVDREYQARMARHEQIRRKNPAAIMPEPRQVKTNSARAVARTLVVESIIKRENITAMPAEVRKSIEKIAEGHPDANAVIERYYGDKDMLISMADSVLKDKALEFIMSRINISEAEIPFSRLVPAQAAPL